MVKPFKDDDSAKAKALNSVLNLGTKLLAGAGLLFCLWVAVSGTFWINEGEVGVHLRFGRILGEGESRIKGPGGPYLALPDPLDRVIVVPTSLQRVAIEDMFWYGRSSREGLRPGEDGSLLTGDCNIVHGKWQASFRVPPKNEDVVNFIENVGNIDRARNIVASIVEKALVRAIGRISIDDFTRGDFDESGVVAYARKMLKDLNCGIDLVSLSRSAPPQVPLQVIDDFMAVNKAESAKLKAVENAWKEREDRLNKAAGLLYEDLVQAIEFREKSLLKGDLSEVEAVDNRIEALFENPDLGGDAATLIQEARLYRTDIAEKFRGKADRFSSLIVSWNKDEDFIRRRLLWESWQEILTGNVNSYYLPENGKKTFYLELKDSFNGF